MPRIVKRCPCLVVALFLFACKPSVTYDSKLFLGSWDTMHKGNRVTLSLTPDGRYNWAIYNNFGQIGDSITGTWKIRGDKIVWTYDADHFPFDPKVEDPQKILEVSAEKFSLKESSGPPTVFTRTPERQEAPRPLKGINIPATPKPDSELLPPDSPPEKEGEKEDENFKDLTPK